MLEREQEELKWPSTMLTATAHQRCAARAVLSEGTSALPHNEAGKYKISWDTSCHGFCSDLD